MSEIPVIRRPIYDFGFSRIDVNNAYELFMQEEGNDLEAEARMHALFGKPPYTFMDAEYMFKVAPLREFGETWHSQGVLIKAFSMLPQYLKEMFKDRPLGYYKDQEGRVYKKEMDTDYWSVLVPRGLRVVGGVDILKTEDKIKLTHASIDAPDIELVVTHLGDQKDATFSILANLIPEVE